MRCRAGGVGGWPWGGITESHKGDKELVGLADKYGAGDEPAHKGLQEAAERRPSV